MGYAKTLTYAYQTVASSSGAIKTITAADANYDCGTLITPAYKDPLEAAYVEVHVNSRSDTSGANNWLVTTSTPYIGLNPGVTFNCGSIPSGELFTPGNTFIGSNWIIYGRTNIATNLDPSTSYTCQLMHTRATGANLLLYNPQFILKLYFST